MRLEKSYPLELVVNFDETPIFFDSLPNYCYDIKGTSKVEVKTPNVQKKRLTAGLGISATGIKLRPMIIFKGTSKTFRNLKNHKSALLEKNSNGWMTNDLFSKWLRNELKYYLLRQRQHSLTPNAKGLLVIDRFAGHFPNDLDKIKEELNIDIHYIPSGCTCELQPLDLMINRSVKVSMRDKWMRWYSKLDLTTQSLASPKRQDIYDWLMKTWEFISPKEVIHAFLKSGISNNLNGEEDILSKNIQIMKELTKKELPQIQEKEEIEEEIPIKFDIEDQFFLDHYKNEEIAEDVDNSKIDDDDDR